MRTLPVKKVAFDHQGPFLYSGEGLSTNFKYEIAFPNDILDEPQTSYTDVESQDIIWPTVFYINSICSLPESSTVFWLQESFPGPV